MAAAMASAMPVLLIDVVSISVSPGRMSPRSSARRIMDSAGRSFTEPAGLLPSNLPKTTLPRAAFSCAPMRQGHQWRVANRLFDSLVIHGHYCAIICVFTNYPPGGEIGRRRGLKIPAAGRAGSIPARAPQIRPEASRASGLFFFSCGGMGFGWHATAVRGAMRHHHLRALALPLPSPCRSAGSTAIYPSGHKGQWLQGGPTPPPNKLQTSCVQPPRHMAERCESCAAMHPRV